MSVQGPGMQYERNSRHSIAAAATGSRAAGRSVAAPLGRTIAGAGHARAAMDSGPGGGHNAKIRFAACRVRLALMPPRYR